MLDGILGQITNAELADIYFHNFIFILSCEISRFEDREKELRHSSGYKEKSVTFGLHIASYRTNNHIKKIVKKKNNLYTQFSHVLARSVKFT